MNRTALSLFAAVALACSAFGQADVTMERIVLDGLFYSHPDAHQFVIHSNGYVFIYSGLGHTAWNEPNVSITTEQALIDAAFGGSTSDAQDHPQTVQLKNAFPNPFNPSTNIDFTLEKTEEVRLVVHNMLGQEVAVILDGLMAPGQHTANFDGLGLASGVYTYTLQAGGFSQTKSFTLVR